MTERVRWEVRISVEKDDEGFRINNNFRAYLARDLIRRHPAVADYIQLRKVQGEEEGALAA